jgi:3-dehydroquinate synthase
MGSEKILGRVRVELGERSYDIDIGTGLIDVLGGKLKSLGQNGRAGIVTNTTVGPLYAGRVRNSLTAAGYEVDELVIPDGESYKSLPWASHIYDWLISMRYDRKCMLVALGGGVIGDLTGYVASTYMRGIPFVQVPTTLLSQVDSSVGGKTGVNHPLGKNMIGCFYQPVYVSADVSTLDTLDGEEYLSGMAEVVKYGVIYDPGFFSFIEDNTDLILKRDPETVSGLVRRSCEIKADVVAKDERESGLRAILNYGHTVGHAIESLTNYTGYRHGEAVSIGMVVAARLAAKQGLCPEEIPDRVEALLVKLGLPVKFPKLSTPAVLSAIAIDKKAEGGTVKMVLPKSIGEVVITKDWDEKLLIESIIESS